MTAKRNHRLGDLQLRIMRVLWNRSKANVSEVQAALGDDELAYTTVATMLRKMEARGLVRHHEDGRRFIYEAAVTEAVVTRTCPTTWWIGFSAAAWPTPCPICSNIATSVAGNWTAWKQLIRQRKKSR